MRIASYNVNGIRAAQRRGFEQWLATSNPDVVALQEVRAQQTDIPDGVYGDYHVAYDEGGHKGRNGVAVLTRQPVAAVRTWSGHVRIDGQPAPVGEVTLARGMREFAHEGRYVEVDLADARGAEGQAVHRGRPHLQGSKGSRTRRGTGGGCDSFGARGRF